MTIKEMFDKFNKSNKINDKIELEKAIVKEKQEKMLESVKAIPVSEKFFANYVASEHTYKAYALENDNGNYTLTIDKVYSISPVEYLENSVSKAEYDKIVKVCSPVLKDMNEFINSIVTENESDTISIKSLKKSLETIYIQFGFNGHVSSKAIKVYVIDKCKASKKRLAINSLKFKDLLSILYSIHTYNNPGASENK